MAESTIKITRRIFNGIVALFTFFGKKTKLKASHFTYVPTPEEKELKETDYMEVLILPEDFKYPYSPKVREVLANHIRAGKNRYEIKKWILEHSKVIKVPIQ